MADKKITELPNINGADLVDADEFVVVDISADETKAITLAELKNAFDAGTGFVRVTGDTMTGVLVMPDGTNSAPSISNTGDTNTGMFFGAADTVSFTAGGTKRLDINTTGIDVTGNMVVSGTVDGVDVATRDGVLTSTTTTANAALPKAGGAVTGNVTFGDNDKAIFGAGSDLQIYHNSANNKSYIEESGSGNLVIRGSDIDILAGNGEAAINVAQDGAVTLYNNNAAKLATTATGININNAGQSQSALSIGGGSTNAALTLRGSTGSAYAWQVSSNAHVASALEFTRSTAVGGTTFSTPSMVLDASGNVGIGVVPEPTWSSNNTALQIGDAGVLFASTNDSFVGLAANAYFDSTNSRYEYINTDFATLYQQLDGTHVWSTAASGSADAAITWSESMRLTSAGNFLAATTDTSLFNNTTGGGFMVAGSSGRTDMARQANVVATMNRTGNSDGDILEFRKDGSVVGSIGTNGGYIHVGSDDVNLRFHAAANAILPATTGGATRNSAIDLGTSGAKYKDLYLSGGVYLGGTGSANKISEYEIGSWTPVIKGNASGNNATMITADARYTKVGSLLYVSAFLNTINFGAITSGTHVVLTGLPYAAQADYYAPIVFGHNNTNLTDGYVETNGLVYLEINGTETQQSANAITGDRFMIGITMNLNE